MQPKSLITPRAITPRNSVTLTLDPEHHERAASLLRTASHAARVLSAGAAEGSAERYSYAEVSFEFDLAAAKLAPKKAEASE